MKHKLLPILIALITLVLNVNAQNPTVMLAPEYSDFNIPGAPNLSPLPTPTFAYGDPAWPVNGNKYMGYVGQIPTNASNMISSATGEIEFFIVDEMVYDKNGYFIHDLTDESGSPIQGASEIVIVPNPTNCQQYYIITTLIKSGTYFKTPYVFLLDMSIVNPNAYNTINCATYGAFIELNPFSSFPLGLSLNSITNGAFDLADPSPGKKSNIFIAASDLTSNNERLVFISNGVGIHRFKIGASGFLYENAFIPFPTPEYNPERSRSEMELIKLQSGNYRIAVPYVSSGTQVGTSINGYSVWQKLFTAELNPNGDVIANSIKEFSLVRENVNSIQYYAALKGVEFSNDGRFLYVTHSTNNIDQDPFEYYDFNNPTPDLIPISVSGGINLRYSMLEVGFNNELFMVNENGLYKMANASIPSGTLQLVSSFNYSATYEGPTISIDKKLYMLPDQIDGMNYSNYQFVNVQCCIANTNYDIDVFEATQSGLWLPGGNPLNNGTGANITIRNELRIKAGVTVTIEDMNLYFAPGARVVVENGNNFIQGAVLRLGRCLLTIDGTCGYADLWKGIEVWGNQNMTQGSWSNSSQGRLEVYSGTRIENAWVGVLVGKRQEVMSGTCPGTYEIQTFAYDDNRTGGVIRIQPGSLFYNNQRGIRMQPYSFNGWNNSSYVHRSKFEWSDNTLLGGFNVQAHIQLESVKGIRILGNEFLNSTSNFSSPVINGIGIHSRASQFTVDVYCSSSVFLPLPCQDETVSTFTNLAFGIHASNPIDNHTFSVNRSDFVNCSRGVYVISTRNERITRNNFRVRQTNYETYGIYLERSSGYTVQENNVYGNFVDPSLNPSDMRSFGIVANSSGVENNLIYKNELGRNLFVGIYNAKVNGSTVPPNFWQSGSAYPSTGLKLRCNTFHNDIHRADIEISGIIHYIQGSANLAFPGSFQYTPAGNLFSTDLNSEHDIMVSPGSQGIRYIHMANPIDNIPNAYTLPNYVHPISVNGWLSQSTHCRSLLNKPIQTLVQNYQEAKTKEHELALIIKGGDPEVQLIAIQQAPTSINTKNLLIQYSPFLTDEVLISYLNSSANSGMKKDVLQANTKLSDTVMQLVISSSLPQGTKNQIIQAQNSTSQKDQIVDSYNHYMYEADQNFNEVLSRLLLDTVQTMDYEQVIAFLNQTNDRKSKKMLIDIHLAKGNVSAMQQVKNALYAEEDLEESYVELQEIKEQIATYMTLEQAMSENSISQAIESLMASTADDFTLGKSTAFNEFIIGPKDVPEIGPFGASMMMIESSNQSEPTVYTIQQIVTIYPNPSTGQVYFDYPEHQEGILSIQLMDLSGKLVFSHDSQSESNGERVDLSAVKKGMYMVRISIDDVYVETQKLLLK